MHTHTHTQLREGGHGRGHREGAPGGSGTDTPVSVALSICTVTQHHPHPLATPRPRPQATFVSAALPGVLGSPHAPSLWPLYPCLGSRARDGEAGQRETRPRHLRGARMIQAQPLPKLCSCLPGPSCACPAPSMTPLLPTLSWVLSSQAPGLLPPLPGCGIFCEFYQLVLKGFHLRNGPVIDCP